MTNATHLACRECDREFPLDPLNVCDFCFGPLEVRYDQGAIKARVTRELIESGPRSIWRYKDLLPVDDEYIVDLGVGYTPLQRADILARKLGMRELWIKNDTCNPSWSFKDRVVAVASSRARQHGFDTLACASTGNLANAVSAHAARAGMRANRLHPARSGGRQGAGLGDLQPHDRVRERLLRRRQPALLGAGRQPRLGLRQHQCAALLLGGLADARVRGCRAVGLEGAAAVHRADGVRLALHQDSQRLRGAADLRPDRGGRGPHDRRPGHRLLADLDRLGERHDQYPPGQAQHDRQESGRSATRPTATTRSRRWPRPMAARPR